MCYDRRLAGGVYCVKALRTRQEGIFSYFEAFSDNDGQFSAITLFLYTLLWTLARSWCKSKWNGTNSKAMYYNVFNDFLKLQFHDLFSNLSFKLLKKMSCEIKMVLKFDSDFTKV